MWDRHWVAPASKSHLLWARKSPPWQPLPGDSHNLGATWERHRTTPLPCSHLHPSGHWVQREQTVPWKGERLVAGQKEVVITEHLNHFRETGGPSSSLSPVLGVVAVFAPSLHLMQRSRSRPWHSRFWVATATSGSSLFPPRLWADCY